MANNYSIVEYDKEHMARALGKSLPISTKESIEICNRIRNLTVVRAKKILSDSASGKSAIPFKRFNADMGHKRKIGPGRFPKKTSSEIIKLLESAESNAQFKGLSTSNLVISHICANRGPTQWHYGRQRRRKMKRTHIEVVVEEKSKEGKNK